MSKIYCNDHGIYLNYCLCSKIHLTYFKMTKKDIRNAIIGLMNLEDSNSKSRTSEPTIWSNSTQIFFAACVYNIFSLQLT